VKKHLNGNDFFGGKEPDMVDVFVYPLVSRLVFLGGSPFNDLFEFLKIAENAPTLITYSKRIRAHPVISQAITEQRFQDRYFEALSKHTKDQRLPLGVVHVIE